MANAALLCDAARHFAIVFNDGMLASHIAATLTCDEVEALAEVLRQAGYPEMADTWIAFHGESDEDGDLHYRNKTVTD